jgi:integrase
MATVRRRSRGKWEVQIRKAGTRHLTKTFTYKRDAEAWARKTESEIERRVYQSPSPEACLVRDLLKRYEEHVVPNQKSINRTVSRLKVLRTHVGDQRLSRLDSVAIAEYRDARLKLVGGNTVRKELVLLQTILDLARREWGVVLPWGNPVMGITKPKGSRPRDRRLEEGEESRLLAALASTPTVRTIVQLAIETGMRRGELVRIQWQHVNLQKRVLQIPETKTGEPRAIPLSKTAAKILSNLPQKRSEAVFDIRGDSVTQAFERACERAGLHDLRFHDLRHEATSRFFELGLTLMEVAAITGHQDLRMLQRYTHLRAEELVLKLDHTGSNKRPN